MNLLSFDGSGSLVAPRGHTQWVRNLRAAGEGHLLLGRRREQLHSDGARGCRPDDEDADPQATADAVLAHGALLRAL